MGREGMDGGWTYAALDRDGETGPRNTTSDRNVVVAERNDLLSG